MNVIDAIHTRHSYRGKYKAAPVPREDLITIMKAGLAAPSGCNKQTTSLIAIDDPEVLKKLHGVIRPGGHLRPHPENSHVKKHIKGSPTGLPFLRKQPERPRQPQLPSGLPKKMPNWRGGVLSKKEILFPGN